MANITFSKNPDGTEVGRWLGKSYREDGRIKKKGQIYLGKVISKEKSIFYKKDEGYFVFNPDDPVQKIHPVPQEDIPIVQLLDRRRRDRNVIVSFGGSYFLDRLIIGIQYHTVLNVIETGNRDSFYALLQYYVLSDKADMHAEMWYQNVYTRFLYPRANLASQRISDLYVVIGRENNRRKYLLNHISYLKKATDDEYAILIDSTGCPNACEIAITKESRHENEVNIEFRVILVVQRSTGLPVYYEIIPGNVVDVSTIQRVQQKLGKLGFKVTMVSGDAGYSCPANIEKLVLCGSAVLMRLNPTYDMYKNALKAHRLELLPSHQDDNIVRYRNRMVKVVKVQTEIGVDKETGEVKQGYIYLCRDLQSYHSKCDHFMKSKHSSNMTKEEIAATCDAFGLFAIVDTRDLASEDVLPEYYMRQSIEQFFDYAKNYGKMMPVRGHSIETIQGHMLMSFITTYLYTVIKNRMNLLDTPYVAIPFSLHEEHPEDVMEIETSGGKVEIIAEQNPLPEVFRSNPQAMFDSLNFVGADVFEDWPDGIDEVLPAVVIREARDFFDAFGIRCPETVIINKDKTLTPILKDGEKDTCRKSMAYSRRPVSTDEKIMAKRDALEKEKLEKLAQAQNAKVVIKGKPGRKKGSKNKKTLEREAERAKQQASLPAGSQPEKRKRGRPKGSKNKKTIEREMILALQAEDHEEKNKQKNQP